MNKSIDTNLKYLYCVLRDYFEQKRKNEIFSGEYDLLEQETLKKAIEQVYETAETLRGITE